jgi:hypothetical protein
MGRSFLSKSTMTGRFGAAFPGAGEIKHKDILSEHAITIRCLSAEKSAVTLDGRLFNVVY